MLIQRLKEYAERNLAEDLADPAFEPQKVHWLLVISDAGEFRGFQPTSGGTIKRGKKEFAIPKSYQIPKSVSSRSSNAVSYPLLAVDSTAYFFGPGPWTKKGQEAKERRHHEAFKNVLRQAAEETSDPALKACLKFYDNLLGCRKAREEWPKEKRGVGDRYAFQLTTDSQPVFQRKTVRDFWKQRFGAVRKTRLEQAAEARCFCCSQTKPALRTHDMKIKGIPGGQPSGLSLISFDKEAFTSHGWEKGNNSSTCPECADKYLRALNHMLDRTRKPVRSDGTQTGAGSILVKIGKRHERSVVFVFWSKEHASFSSADLLNEPTPESVEKLFQASPAGLRAEANAFYAVALSANGGRAVVRDWIETTLEEAKDSLGNWFRDLEIVLAREKRQDGTVIRAAGELALPPNLNALCGATARELDEVIPHIPVDLIRAALQGTPLPWSVLEACLRRCRLGSDGDPKKLKFTPARMGLIRCALNRSVKEGDPIMDTALARDCSDPGYLCGRLLAVLGRLQYLALGDVGATVVDRFYARASVAPQLVFPTLFKLARHHIAKADEKWSGAGANTEKEIEEVLSRLPCRPDGTPDFPVILNLAHQGRFAIGFYHQQAWHRVESQRKKEERSEAKEARKEAQVVAG